VDVENGTAEIFKTKGRGTALGNPYSWVDQRNESKNEETKSERTRGREGEKKGTYS